MHRWEIAGAGSDVVAGDSSQRKLFDTVCEITAGVELGPWIGHVEERGVGLDVQELFQGFGVPRSQDRDQGILDRYRSVSAVRLSLPGSECFLAAPKR